MPIRSLQRVPVPQPSAMMALGAPGAAALAVAYAAQTERNWCWAACAEMLFGWNGNARTQCAVASTHLNLGCCMVPHAPSPCDQGAWPDIAYPPQGLPTMRVDAPLSLARIRGELNAGKPIQVCYQWTGGSQTHVALIVGELPNGDFDVLDPWPANGPGPRSLDQINTAYGQGKWILSFTF